MLHGFGVGYTGRMFDWVTEAVIIAAIAALGGASASVVAAMKNRGDHRLNALQTTVTLLSNRVEHLEKSLLCAEERADAAADEARQAERLLWHVVSYLREVMAWAKAAQPTMPEDGAPPPPPPDTIKEYL